MTYRNERERELVVDFARSGGRFHRFIHKPHFQIYQLDSLNSVYYGISINTSNLDELSNLIVRGNLPPGDRRVLSLRGSRFLITNGTSVTTVAYRTVENNLEFAAVTWHPENEEEPDVFQRQENLAHAMTRFHSARNVVPLNELKDFASFLDMYEGGTSLRMNRDNTFVVYMSEGLIRALLKTYGHYASRSDREIDLTDNVETSF